MHFLVQRLSVCLAAALVFASALGAEQSEASKTVTRLNNEILRVYSRSVRGGGDTSAVREQAKELLQQREAALAALVAESPSAALDAALPADVASDVARAFPESAARVERRGSLIGVLEIEVEDNEELTDHRLIHRLRVGRDRYRMRFSGDSPAAEAGSLMRVDGMLVGESIVAESASLTTEADAAASCSTTGVQRIAVIKVKFPGSNPTLPNASLDSWMFGSSGKTVSNYWDENSYGAAWADGDVYPAGTDAWYTLDREYTCAESDALRNAALQAANGNVNFQNYQRAVIVFPKPTSGCSFAGRASIGCWVSSPDGNTISYALQVLSSMGTQEKTVQLTTHEGGHTLGLYHASTVDYGADALGPTTSGGTRDEYGDRYSSMGFWTDGHYAAPQKKQLGWLNPTSVNSSGTFTVVPFSNTSGIRALDIKRGSTGTQRIWLEYRRQLGQFNEAPPAYPGNGALLHLGNGNSNSLLLDFTPSSAGGFLDATLESGQTWDDPYSDLVIKIGSATNSGLQVTVSYGTAAPCSANPPTISVSPSSKSTNYPTATSYTVTVTNNDTSACASSSYTMTSKALYNGGATSEVSTSVNNPVLTIAPGATGTTTLVATPSVQPPDARNYMVSAKAARSTPAQSAEDDAGLTVVPPLQCVTAAPVITLSPVSRTAQYPTGTTFTASLKNNDNSACSATSFTMSAFAQLGGQAAGNISTTVAPSLSVAPGATMTTTVTVTPTSAPSSQSTYSITARAARANPSQTVQASSTFTVTLPAATCQPKVPTVSLSPDSRNTEFPKQASFTLTVLNNDSSACTAGSFSISGTTTNLASTGVSASLLSIAPGASKTAIVTVTPTKSVTAPTNHTVTARVSRSSPSQLVQDTAILIVTPPAATCVRTLPSVTMTPTSGSTAYPNPLSYTVSLTNNDTAVCGTSTLALTTSALFGGLTTTEVTVTPSAVGLNVAPGATASTVVVATPRVLPSSSKSYAVKAAVTRTVQTGTAQKTASLTVTPPSIAPPSASTVDVVVSVIGSGGTVKIDPLGVSCPGGCTKKVNTSQWQPLTLTAIPSGNSCVQALIGCSSSSGNTCTLSTAKNYNVTVQFGRCTGVGGQSGGKTRVSRLPATADATSTGRGRKR